MCVQSASALQSCLLIGQGFSRREHKAASASLVERVQAASVCTGWRRSSWLFTTSLAVYFYNVTIVLNVSSSRRWLIPVVFKDLTCSAAVLLLYHKCELNEYLCFSSKLTSWYLPFHCRRSVVFKMAPWVRPCIRIVPAHKPRTEAHLVFTWRNYFPSFM